MNTNTKLTVGLLSMLLLLGAGIGLGAAETVNSQTVSVNESESITVDVEVVEPTNITITVTNTTDSTESYIRNRSVNSTQLSDGSYGSENSSLLITETIDTNGSADYSVAIEADNTTDVNQTFIATEEQEGAILGIGDDPSNLIIIGLLGVFAFVAYRASDYEI